jgi:hypothetical protein
LSSRKIAHCSCGRLRTEVQGDAELVGACSCGECQRRSGTVLGVSAYWLRKNVNMSGAASKYTRKGHSGNDVIFRFCPNCGSTVYWELGIQPDWIGIGAGMFNDPDFPQPMISIFEKNKHGWLTVPAGLHFEDQPNSV